MGIVPIEVSLEPVEEHVDRIYSTSTSKVGERKGSSGSLEEPF
jgi:hypothetical protein